ncbi:MAG TPA: hypothetical protein ENH41_00230 [Candidatus Omnitrophica bacterium]|nr:hypothetical protein [Candidatus Omnitrophota bacterium]
MARLKKGGKLLCVPCGREIIIDACGVSKTTIWCCSRPMKSKSKAKPKIKRRIGKKQKTKG